MDPYTEFWDLFRRNQLRKTPLYAAIGNVVATKPMQIRAADLVYDAQELRVNSQLPDDVAVGDEVLCLSTDSWQTLFVLCKVVNA